MRKMVAALVGIIGLIMVIAGIVLKAKEHAAVSIIGGADGPTAIFIAGKVSPHFVTGLILIGIVLLILLVAWIWKKRK